MVQRADSGTDLLSQPKPAQADGDMPRSYRLGAEAQTVDKIEPLFQDIARCSSETIDEDGPEQEEELIEDGTEEDDLEDDELYDLDDEDETEDWGEDEDEDDELDDDDVLDDEEPDWNEDDFDDDMTEEVPLVEDDFEEE